MFQPTKNLGVLHGMNPSGKDYIAGENSPLAHRIRVENGDWKPFLPTKEKQWGTNGDKMNCVTQSKNNVLEIQAIRDINTGEMPESALGFLKSGGYMDENGLPNFNDRIDATLNETMPTGNWLWKVADYGRRFGLFPESVLPSDENLTWDEYYNKVVITPEILKNYGEESKKHFETAFEWVQLTKESLMWHLKHAPIQIVFPNHAVANVMSEGDVVEYFDTYDPFLKKLGFEHLTSAMKIILTPKATAPITKMYKVNQNGKLGILITEGFSGSLIFENDFAEYQTLLKITAVAPGAPTINIPSGRFFRINDHGKLGIIVVEGFSGTVLFENDFSEYKELLKISGMTDQTQMITLP